ncbi:hypothetical protein AB4Z01_35760 [Inquilinus sp. YAF38]|uniref:hypothetical protein n=1 Tax=Inquilinus sp. YAF38 TaxID=3233084 RepID=UPI003F93DD81
MMTSDLEAEAKRATELLIDKTVKVVRRANERVVLIEFSDGARLFVDSKTPSSFRSPGQTNPSEGDIAGVGWVRGKRTQHL